MCLSYKECYERSPRFTFKLWDKDKLGSQLPFVRQALYVSQVIFRFFTKRSFKASPKMPSGPRTFYLRSDLTVLISSSRLKITTGPLSRSELLAVNVSTIFLPAYCLGDSGWWHREVLPLQTVPRTLRRGRKPRLFFLEKLTNLSTSELIYFLRRGETLYIEASHPAVTTIGRSDTSSAPEEFSRTVFSISSRKR